jgi:hypothetical protein
MISKVYHASPMIYKDTKTSETFLSLIDICLKLTDSFEIWNATEALCSEENGIYLRRKFQIAILQ